MGDTVKVDFLAFHTLKNAVDAMQGHTFYREDTKGNLRRWTPPRPFNDKKTPCA
jgi:hypothetical protein